MKVYKPVMELSRNILDSDTLKSWNYTVVYGTGTHCSVGL